MRKRSFLLALLALFVISCGCSLPFDGISDAKGVVTPTSQPGILAMADVFIGSCAFIDENHNGEIDDADLPIEGARFVVTLAMGGEMSTETYTDGCAHLVIPVSGMEDADEKIHPATVRMIPPEGSHLRVIGEEEVILVDQASRHDFLFERVEP